MLRRVTRFLILRGASTNGRLNVRNERNLNRLDDDDYMPPLFIGNIADFQFDATRFMFERLIDIVNELKTSVGDAIKRAGPYGPDGGAFPTRCEGPGDDGRGCAFCHAKFVRVMIVTLRDDAGIEDVIMDGRIDLEENVRNVYVGGMDSVLVWMRRTIEEVGRGDTACNPLSGLLTEMEEIIEERTGELMREYEDHLRKQRVKYGLNG